ncbi:MAG: alpha/beta hydrolase [Kangiellaceae bacterium]|jgi:acetyl esterase/lipase|nr:alpha/beta hydrolase [Kangiellaceae bacterium]
MLWLLFFLVAFVVVSYVFLRGENLSYLDRPVPRHPQRTPGAGMRSVLMELSEAAEQIEGLGLGRKRIQRIRQLMDDIGRKRETSCSFHPVEGAEVRGEWVLAPGHDSDRRLLYIHGGAFLAGSPLSHRPITDRLARLTGCAVFAVDYRLMPEHSRVKGVEDCRRAYRWLLDNGPEGRAAASFMLVAGDSAGGSLTLTTLAWIRDTGLRQADAAIALSPSTDAALDAPSLRENAASDPMLGPVFGPLTRVPKIFLLWYTLFTTRMRPADPRVSPLRGSLAGLPPILIQASDSEMLLDDARRYVAKARAAESPVQLQTWPDMVHVWQLFIEELPEAEEAYQRIGEFLEGVASTEDSAAA